MPELPANKPTPLVVKGLEDKYRRTLGEKEWLRKAEYEWDGRDGYRLALAEWKRRRTSLDLSLAAIEHAIRLYDPRWDGSGLAPIAFRPKRTQRGQRAGLTPDIAKILREAEGPLTVREIYTRVASDAGLKADTTEERQRLSVLVRGFLQRHHEKGMVLRYAGDPIRWALSGRRNPLPDNSP